MLILDVARVVKVKEVENCISLSEYQTLRCLMDCCRRHDCCDSADGSFRCHSRCQHKKLRSIWQVFSLHRFGSFLFRLVLTTQFQIEFQSKFIYFPLSNFHFNTLNRQIDLNHKNICSRTHFHRFARRSEVLTFKSLFYLNFRRIFHEGDWITIYLPSRGKRECVE